MRHLKLWMMAAILACGTMTVSAQDTKHEIAVSYGVGANSDVISIFEDLIKAPFNGKLTRENETYYGPIGLEYYYHTSKMVSVGAIMTYGHRGYDLMVDGTKKGELTDSYLTLMPSVKFTWLNTKAVGLYSKLALGATYRMEKDDDLNHSENELHVNWQVSLLGFEAGSPKFRGFVEVGTGEQGILLAGLRCKF